MRLLKNLTRNPLFYQWNLEWLTRTPAKLTNNDQTSHDPWIKPAQNMKPCLIHEWYAKSWSIHKSIKSCLIIKPDLNMILHINQIRIFQTMLLIHTTPWKDQARPAGNGVKASWLLCGYVAWHQHFATGWPHQNRGVPPMVNHWLVVWDIFSIYIWNVMTYFSEG